jgi:hypothetical protein
VNDTEKLEALLGRGGEIRLGRREAQEVLQKLRARGSGSEAAIRLESKLEHGDELVLDQDEAHALLEELHASGRRWVFGTDAPRERPAPQRKPEPEPERPRRLRRLWRR